jgi:hypothetical protein
VVQVLTSHPNRPSDRAIVEGGTLGTGRVSLFAGSRSRGWSYSAGGEWFSTDGYITVSETQDPGISPRGPIDTNSTSAHLSGLASLGYHADNGWRFEASGNVFSETGMARQRRPTVRQRGTLGEAAGESAEDSSRRDLWRQGYDQSFQRCRPTGRVKTSTASST